MRPAGRLLLFALLAVASILACAGPASAQECPTATFLSHDHLVYASEPIPASASLAPGASLGEGTIDEPTDETGCKRQREDVSVVRLGDVDPAVAVGVEGRPGLIFVLGARCAGYEGDARTDCLLQPLVFRDVSYTRARYPAQPPPVGAVPAGEPLGSAELDGESVTVVSLEGIDPALAVGVEGRASEAFVAPGICPYERFSNEGRQDDLLRCLKGPVWLVFDPVGAKPGEEITARSDRPLRPELQGAEVSLVRLSEVADIVPEDRSEAVAIGTLTPDESGRVTLPFTVPELEEGLYEAVVGCEPCGEALGATVFPSGSVVVFEGQKGSSARPVLLAGGGLMFAFLALAIVAWRRGWHRRQPAPPPD